MFNRGKGSEECRKRVVSSKGVRSSTRVASLFRQSPVLMFRLYNAPLQASLYSTSTAPAESSPSERAFRKPSAYVRVVFIGERLPIVNTPGSGMSRRNRSVPPFGYCILQATSVAEAAGLFLESFNPVESSTCRTSPRVDSLEKF